MEEVVVRAEIWSCRTKVAFVKVEGGKWMGKAVEVVKSAEMRARRQMGVCVLVILARVSSLEAVVGWDF